MKHWMASLGLATLAALASSGAHASATYYLSDCQAGAVSGCVAGSNATGAGTSASPWQSVAKLPALRAGDTVYFAKGGSWMFAGPWGPTFGTQTAPLTYASYQAAWCSSAACAAQKPSSACRREMPASYSSANGGDPQHKEGLVISGLELKAGAGLNSTSAGVFIYNDSDWITLDGLTISGFNIGIQLAGANPVGTRPSDGINQYITVRNSSIHDNLSMGILGSATDLLIENNALDNNGGSNAFDHNIYLSGTQATPGTRMVIRGNTSTRAATGGTGACKGIQLVFHGVIDGLVLENNTVDGSAGAGSDGGCYGIAVDNGYSSAESFRNVVIRGNRIIDVGYIGIGVDTCVSCTIEDNVVVWGAATGLAGRTGIAVPVAMPNSTGGSGDIEQDQVTVRNNSVYVANGAPGSVGILLDSFGTNHTVVSNLVYFGPGSGHACFRHGSLSMYTAFDNNLCFDANPNSKWSNTYSTLTSAQRAGFDLHGLNSDPLLATTPSATNGYSMTLKPGSPGLGAGNQDTERRDRYDGSRARSSTRHRRLAAGEYFRPRAPCCARRSRHSLVSHAVC